MLRTSRHASGCAPPGSLLHEPRSTAEHWPDVREWREEPVGGHFAACKQPEAWVAGLHSAVALAEGSASS